MTDAIGATRLATGLVARPGCRHGPKAKRHRSLLDEVLVMSTGFKVVVMFRSRVVRLVNAPGGASTGTEIRAKRDDLMSEYRVTGERAEGYWITLPGARRHPTGFDHDGNRSSMCRHVGGVTEGRFRTLAMH